MSILSLMVVILVLIVCVGGLVALGIFLVVYLGRQPEKKNNEARPAVPPVPPVFPKTQVMPRPCPQCGATLKPDAPEGLCPACLLQRGFATEGAGAAGPGVTPPSIAELAALFPQLQILECLGRGGMGAVYKARQPLLDRFVALKIISSDKQHDAQFAERFGREARALARLNHPNIVTVYEFGEVQGRFYLLMEFVDGLTLRQILRLGKLAPTEALKIVPKICEALQYAHEQGIVHRDIKPENILVDKQGRVKIADFGIAKIAGLESKDMSLTGAKDVMGTPHYMAPEQVEQPQTVDHRADIYSLGVVFYEMLTGELPLGKFPPPSAKTLIDERLDEVVMHALEKEPARRYQHASEVKTDVETIAGGPTMPKAAPAAASAAGPAPITPLPQPVTDVSEKTILPAFLLAFFFGVFGAHRFYMGKIGTAFLQLAGLGGCVLLIIACATTGDRWEPTAGICLGFLILGCVTWATIDWILIVCKAFRDGEGKRISNWVNPGPEKVMPEAPLNSGSGSGATGMTAPAAAAAVPGWMIAPAIGLMVAGVWKIFTALMNFISILFLTGGGWEHHFGTGPIQFEGFVPMVFFSSVVFGLLPGLLILFGGYQMWQWRSYGWAVAAGILSIVACGLISSPVGIWALIVLARDEVRVRFGGGTSGASPGMPRTATSNRKAVAVIGIVAGILIVVVLFFGVTTLLMRHFSSAIPPLGNWSRMRNNSFGGGQPVGNELTQQQLQQAGIRQEAGEYWKNISEIHPITPDGQFSLDNVNGQIEIQGWNSNVVSVQAVIHGWSSARVNAVQVNVTAAPDDVSVHTVMPSEANNSWWGWPWSGHNGHSMTVDYVVHAPARTLLDSISSVNGNVVISGITGNISVTTVNGATDLKDAAANVKISTVNGRITAQMAVLGGDQNLVFDTVNGPIELRLPAAADASFSASTLNGRITSGFSGLEPHKEFPVGSKLSGNLGAGSASVKATTVNGGMKFLQNGMTGE